MTRYRRRDGVSERQIDDELFLVVPDTEAVFHLNPVGTAIWRLLAEAHSLDDLHEILGGIFTDAAPHQLRADAEAFLGELAGYGLLRDADGD